MKIRHLIPAIFITITLCRCVTLNKYNAEVAKRQAAEAELADVKTKEATFETKCAELDAALTESKKAVMLLSNDTLGCGMRYRLLSSQYDQLTANYELLLKQNKDLMARQSNENTQLVGQLNLTQEQLIKKEDSLRKMQTDLFAQKKSLDSLNLELKKREARVAELQHALDTKDSAMNAINSKVKAALLSFEGKGLTVTMKDGKVYVSMEDKLLFASGSTAVQSDGVKALKELAKVLEANPDINITVEGHTDNNPYHGSGDIKDNWDLSVMRATSVTKILLANGKIDAKRITASGRGEFFPLDAANTDAARAKNRRTEIILTPNLDALYQILYPTTK
ncbi:MAG TPA: OmpA family protein [Bacteroidia bacterium]|jgi:chemotaxis protein MotB|nr:OmpA family protein [Bacteroidia bacterium]